MKKLKLMLIGLFLIIASATQAQVSINVNIGSPPVWGPVGYAPTEYYYLPDIEAYYDLRATQFIYFGRGQWNRSNNLPPQYRNYDLHHGYKVVLNDYHGRRPYANFNSHKSKYYKGYKGKPQRSREYRHDDDDHNDDHHEYKKNKEKGNHKH